MYVPVLGFVLPLNARTEKYVKLIIMQPNPSPSCV